MSTHKGLTIRARWRSHAGRRAFTVLDATAPHLAARVGSVLWFRLPPVASVEHRRRLEPAGGTPFEVRRHGLTVRGRVFGGGDAPTAYLVHGWGGHWQQLGGYVRLLSQLGYRVVVHDAPSHGDSAAGAYGPRSSRVMEMAHAHALVVERHGTAALTVAHSLGAMVALWAANHHGAGTGALVTLAAATELDELVDTFRRITGLGVRCRAELLDHIERAVGHPRAAFSGPTLAGAALKRHGVVPMIAVHDISDPEAPSAMSEQLVRSFPGGTLLLTQGLGHRRVVRDPMVVERVAQFAAEQQSRSHPTATVPGVQDRYSEQTEGSSLVLNGALRKPAKSPAHRTPEDR